MLKYLQAGGDLCDVKISVKSKGERDALAPPSFGSNHAGFLRETLE